MSDIEGSEPDWRSCEGSSEQVWATSEFQLSEGGLACHAIAWQRRKIFDYFGDDDVGGLALTARRQRLPTIRREASRL